MRTLFILTGFLIIATTTSASSATHEGATYPLKTFPPDCSQYIDPKDSRKYSHCEKINPYHSKKWKGYLEFMGKPGTARSLGQADLFFPLAQDKNDMTFFNVRGNVDFGSDNSEYNIGLGHRHIFDKWIIGAYGYFDKRSSETDNKFNQVMFGLEALSETWDFRANGYIPETGTETITTNLDITVVRPGDQIKARIGGIFEEKALPGLDAEAGYKLSIFEDTRIYLGAYHFIGSGIFDSVTGPRLRLETRIHDLPFLGADSRLMLGLETQYDSPRGSQTFGLVSLRVPFGIGTTRSRPGLKGLDRRMMEPVVRDVDVVVETANVPTELAPLFNLNDKEIDIAFDMQMDPSIVDEDARKEDMAIRIRARMDTMKVAGRVPVFFIGGIEGDAVTVMNTSNVTVRGNQIMASMGKELVMTYKSNRIGTGRIGYTKEGTQVGTGCEVLGMNSLSQVNGWTVDGTDCTTGLLIDHGKKSYLTNSTVFGAESENIKIAAGSLHVDGLTLYGTDTGVLITETGKLRGVEGTSGTLGYSADNTPGGADNDEAVVIVLDGITGDPLPIVDIDTIDTLQESYAQVAGVTVNATGYSNGMRILAPGVNYFVTNTTVENAENIGLRVLGYDPGLQVQGHGVELKLTNSKFNNNINQGININGAAVIAKYVEANYNGTSATTDDCLTDHCRIGIYVKNNNASLIGSNLTASYNSRTGLWAEGKGTVVDVKNSEMSYNHSRRVGNLSASGVYAATGSNVTLNNVRLIGNQRAGALVQDVGTYLKITNSLAEGNTYGFSNEGQGEGNSNELIVENSVARNNGIGIFIWENKATITDTQVIGNGTGLYIGGNQPRKDIDTDVTLTRVDIIDSIFNGINIRDFKHRTSAVTMQDVTIDGFGQRGIYIFNGYHNEEQKNHDHNLNHGSLIFDFNNSTIKNGTRHKYFAIEVYKGKLNINNSSIFNNAGGSYFEGSEGEIFIDGVAY